MGTFTSSRTFDGAPKEVLGVLTDLEAARRWSPIPFELEGETDSQLRTGSHARLRGRLGGRQVRLELEILRADCEALDLQASGPIEIEAHYRAVPEDGRTRLMASVTVRAARGLVSRLLSGAADALLAAGALDQTVRSVAREVAA